MTRSNGAKTAKFEIKKTERLYDGFLKLDRHTLRYRKYDDSQTEWLERECITPPAEVVAVLLADRNLGSFVFVEQFRIGAAASANPWLIEIVAGYADQDGNDLILSAKREVQEEAGIEIEQLTPICSYWVSPGETSDRMHLFFAEVDASSIGEFGGLDEEHEDIRIVTMPFQDCFEKMQSGGFDNAMTLIALQWFQLTHPLD